MTMSTNAAWVVNVSVYQLRRIRDNEVFDRTEVPRVALTTEELPQ